MFISSSFCSSPAEGSRFSGVEKAAFGVDALVVANLVACAALCYLSVGPFHSQIVSYCLGGAAAAIAIANTAKATYRLWPTASKNSPKGLEIGKDDKGKGKSQSRAHTPRTSLKRKEKDKRRINEGEGKDDTRTSGSAGNKQVVCPNYRKFIVPPDDYAKQNDDVAAVGRPMCLKERFYYEYKSPIMRQQGIELDSEFYFQKVHGGGNCFYLAYLSGLLHYLVATGDFDRIVQIVKSNSPDSPEGEALLRVLTSLQQDQTPKNLYSILESPQVVQPLIQYLRNFAVDKVRNDETTELFYFKNIVASCRILNRLYFPSLVEFMQKLVGHPEEFENILGILNQPKFNTIREKDAFLKALNDLRANPTVEYMNELLYSQEHDSEVQQLIQFLIKLEAHVEEDKGTGNALLDETLTKIREADVKGHFCAHQQKDGVDIQVFEINSLHNHFLPFTKYNANMEHRNDKTAQQNGGEDATYPKGRAIVLISRFNHYDCLLPKAYHLEEQDDQKA